MNVTWENELWAEAYRLAVIEADQTLRNKRIQEARSAIQTRIKELSDSQAQSHELTALNDALVILRVWAKDVA